MSMDTIDDLEFAEGTLGDWAHTTRGLLDRIDGFELDCSRDDYTDTGDAWDLLNAIRDGLQNIQKEWSKFCRPTCQFLDEGECQDDDEDTCGCPCEHELPPGAHWAIVQDGGVADRFMTKDEAEAALNEGGYPDDVAVEFSPDPDPEGTA